MEISNTAVLSKTSKGSEEMASRKWGLNPRLRQVLILVDGRRTYGDLCKMMGEKEMGAYALALQSDGFVEVNGSSTAASITQVASVQAPVIDGATALQKRESYESDVAVAAEPTRAMASIAPAATVDFATARKTMLRVLSDSLGPFAQDISIRIEKAKSISELKELLPAACSVVEAVRGKSAVGDFLNKIGRL